MNKMMNLNSGLRPYAALTHLAHEFGGPEDFLDVIEQGGIKIGRISMLPALGIAVVGGGVLVYIAERLNGIIMTRKAEIQISIEQAKAVLLKKMKGTTDAQLEKADENIQINLEADK